MIFKVGFECHKFELRPKPCINAVDFYSILSKIVSLTLRKNAAEASFSQLFPSLTRCARSRDVRISRERDTQHNGYIDLAKADAKMQPRLPARQKLVLQIHGSSPTFSATAATGLGALRRVDQ
jgi:hypothetical protein